MTILRRSAGLLLSLLLLLAAPLPAVADDLADEADLQFQLGATRYKADDFQGALEHFLASNRLVPNRNVVFNIARSFEKLKRYADAYRYYVQAMEAEREPAAKARIEEALQRLQPSVALLEISSDPDGATIYIDRKELGPRGVTPRLLAFPDGKYQVLGELDGCEPAAAAPVELKAGTVTKVALSLRRILGTVRFEAAPAGTRVSVDDEAAAAVGSLPLELSLSPGRHTLYLKHPGFRTATAVVDVVEKAVVTVRPELTPITGALVVNVDESDALVEVDGKPMGFAPVVLQLPIGRRNVKITRAGFRPAARSVEIDEKEEARLDVELRLREDVTAASRKTEALEDAPGSVSIISGAELRAMHYPTLTDALRGTRGLYVSDDGTYAAVGFRGLARPGDYGNRVLVLLDGMPTNDNWIGSSFVGYDLRTDLDDIERIEVVRGAGSVLYGTGALSGVVNLVPRGIESREGVEAGLSASGSGVAHVRASGTAKFSDSAGFWATFAAAKGRGDDFTFPELADPSLGQDGNVRGLDGFDAGMITGRGYLGDFNLQFSANVRDKDLATAPYGAKFADARTRFLDGRGLVELRHEPKLGDHVRLLSRLYANRYQYEGNVAYEASDGGLQQERFLGVWYGLEERVVVSPIDLLRITLGAEGQLHTTATQSGTDDDGSYLERDDPFKVGAGYLLVDLEPGDFALISVGARLDAYSTFGTSLSPRATLVLHPFVGNTVKLLGGKAFRAPSDYELHYTSSTQEESPDLKPETMYTAEVEVSQRLGTSWTVIGSGFGNYVDDLVVSQGSGLGGDLLRYTNSEYPIVTLGGEAELRRDWRQGFMVGASYSYQHSRYQHAAGVLREVPNSPEHLASLRGAAPLFTRVVTAATRLSIEGPRADRYDQETDPAQGHTGTALVWDVVVSGRTERFDLAWAAGIYNAFDQRYSVPLSAEYTQRTLVQPGRTFLLSASLAL